MGRSLLIAWEADLSGGLESLVDQTTAELHWTMALNDRAE